jgi:hypothetical protein
MTRPAGLTLQVRDGGAGAVCADVLAALPEWFGFPDSVADYVESADTHPTVVATVTGRDCGILTLRAHTPYAAEIVVRASCPSSIGVGSGERCWRTPRPGWPDGLSRTCR